MCEVVSEACTQHLKEASIEQDIDGRTQTLKYNKEDNEEDDGEDDGKNDGVQREEPVMLRRKLGLCNGVSTITTLVVGGGIFLTPGTVLESSGSVMVCLLMWLAGGVVALLASLSLAELGTRYSNSGEKYVYLKVLCGRLPAFCFLWQYILLLRPASNAIKVLLCARYLLKPFFPTCKIPELAIKLISCMLVFIFGILNSLSVHSTARGQAVMAFVTIATILFISSIGLYRIALGHHEHLKSTVAFAPPPSSSFFSSFSSLVQAFRASIYGYLGWGSLNFVIEELKHPRRNLPLAIIISTILITFLYTIVNISYIVLLGYDKMVSTEAVATSATSEVLGRAEWLMCLFIATTAASSFNSSITLGSRIAYAGSLNKDLPHCLSLLTLKQLTPAIAIIFQCLLTLGFVLFSSVVSIINSLIFCTLLFELIVATAYIRIRWKERHKPSLDGVLDTKNKIFKVPIAVHLAYSFLLLVVIVTSLSSNPLSFALAFALPSLVSLLYYVLFLHHPSFFSAALNPYSSSVTVFLQKLFICAETER